jgi:hypothetical protein
MIGTFKNSAADSRSTDAEKRLSDQPPNVELSSEPITLFFDGLLVARITQITAEASMTDLGRF